MTTLMPELEADSAVGIRSGHTSVVVLEVLVVELVDVVVLVVDVVVVDVVVVVERVVLVVDVDVVVAVSTRFVKLFEPCVTVDPLLAAAQPPASVSAIVPVNTIGSVTASGM